MNKKVLGILTAGLLTSSLNATPLQDYIFVGVGGGELKSSILGTSSKDKSKIGNVSVGFVKQDTHRFSLNYLKDLSVKKSNNDINNRITTDKIKINYDFMIKNLDTQTSVYFGPSLSLNILNVGESVLDLDSDFSLGIGGRVGVTQDFGKLIQLDLSYENSFDYLPTENTETMRNEFYLLAVNFKF